MAARPRSIFSILMASMFLLALLLLALLVGDCQSSSPRTVVLSSIPLHGHAFPLVSLGNTLAARSWRVYLASCSSARRSIDNQSAVEFLDLGPCAAEQSFPDVARAAANSLDALDSLALLQRWTIDLVPEMYEKTMKMLKQREIVPDLIIMDSVTYAAWDVAEALGVPLVVNNADLLSTLSLAILPPGDSVPPLNSRIPLALFTENAAVHTLWRSILPAIRMFFTVFIQFSPESPQEFLNRRRASVGLDKPVDMLTMFSKRLVLVNNGFGLEYFRALPPNIQLTGPMMNLQENKDFLMEKLTEEEKTWLEASSTPVIFVSAGTIVPLSSVQLSKFALAFLGAPFRVLWKLQKHEVEQLPQEFLEALKTSENLRVVDWVSSQLGLLAHPAVAGFVSHCGINSAYESAWLARPLVCMPIFADQNDMAIRVEDAGLGLRIDKETFDSAQLRLAIESIIREKSKFSAALQKTRSLMALHGGLEQAANWVEFVWRYGTSSLVPLENVFPWYSQWSFDVAAVYFFVFWALKLFTCALGRLCCAPARQCQNKRKNKED